MPTKDITIITLPATIVANIQADEVDVVNGWLQLYIESIDRRFNYPYSNPAYQKIQISPTGIAYPGDGDPGFGSKRVHIDLTTNNTSIMTHVEDVDLTKGGWLYIIKGNHVVMYSRLVVRNFYMEPTP